MIAATAVDLLGIACSKTLAPHTHKITPFSMHPVPTVAINRPSDLFCQA